MKHSKPNVLMVAVDDLRPELACYGRGHMVTPHIDALSASAMRFDKAHCQFPVCGASRASFMTGLRPLPRRFTHYATYAHRDASGIVTLPEHFRRQGYTTLSHGKIFHHADDSPQAWSEPAWSPSDPFPGYRDPVNVCGYLNNIGENGYAEIMRRGPPYERYRGPDSAYPDYQTTDVAIESLERLSGGPAPFFLGVGYLRPHLPFNAPEKYWALYDGKKVPPPPSQIQPTDVPLEALHHFPELWRCYSGVPEIGPVSQELAATLRQGYWASVSYLDAQIGRLLGAVDRLGLGDDTIVVLCVDHGWNLGEHGMWCKNCMFETSLHVPLIIRVPGKRPGVHRPAVENLGIYPTLCDLCDLPRPEHKLEGLSLAPVFDNPEKRFCARTFSRHLNSETIYEDGWRYAEWRQDGKIIARTLFDQNTDPGEERNLAEHPAHAAKVAALSSQLPVWSEEPWCQN